VSTPFLSEIKIMSFGFAPKGWAQCNGQLLPINQNQALFSILGTTYGGDGRTTFGLPNLQGRTPVHFGGGGINLGELGGEAAHTLNVTEMPAHGHMANATSSVGNDPIPAGNLLAEADNLYAPLGNTGVTTLSPGTVSTTPGGGQPHNNLQPYLVLNFCIALQGIFPSQT
jgi:microcystin-dependent protein